MYWNETLIINVIDMYLYNFSIINLDQNSGLYLILGA